MLFKTVLQTIVLTFSSSFLHAQIYKDTTPLHSFFKANFDSVIIYNQWSSWHPYPNYYILAKKDSVIYYFTYKSAYSRIQGLSFPADLSKKFMQEEGTFKATIPDTNRYFLPVYIYYAKRNLFWSQINRFNVWSFKEVEECSNECEVDDGDFDTYYLITKQGIATKTFYAADFYETCKPSNINRINEIELRNTILKIFGN